MVEWTDSEGTRAVLHDDGWLSVYGSPSMTRADGVVAIGVALLPSGEHALRTLLASMEGAGAVQPILGALDTARPPGAS